MTSRDELREAIKAVRSSATGLTRSVLEGQQVLLRVLGTDDADVAVDLLNEAVNRLTQTDAQRDRFDAQALRGALGIGLRPLKNVTARRRVTKQLKLFVGSDRGQFDAEDRAIDRLVDLLVQEAAKHHCSEVSSVTPSRTDLAAEIRPQPSPALPAVPVAEITDTDHRPDQQPRPDGSHSGFGSRWWRRRRVRVLLAGAGGVTLVVGLVVAAAALIAQNRPIYIDPKITVVAPTAALGRGGASPPPLKLDNSHGWGPERATFTDQVPADHPVFNSITNSGWKITNGDERQFLSCWDRSKSSPRDTEVVADDGHIYGCLAYFSNDIADNLDNGTSLTQLVNAKIAVSLPTTSLYNPGITAFLSADNAQTVWASTNFVSPRPMRIIYQYGSARMYTSGTPDNGLQLAETDQAGTITNGIVTASGSLLGYNRQDGILRHSYKYSGYVVFDIKVVLDPPAN